MKICGNDLGVKYYGRYVDDFVLNSYLGLMQHFKTYRLRRKTLLSKSHEFFRYGYLDRKLTKYYGVEKVFEKRDSVILAKYVHYRYLCGD